MSSIVTSSMLRRPTLSERGLSRSVPTTYPARFSAIGIRIVFSAFAGVQPGLSAVQVWMNDTLMSNTS